MPVGVRFLHTSDWQLGMTRAFLPTESQARYSDDQIEAVRKLARVAEEYDCAFVVVAGDVFDSIQPDHRVLTRAIDALTTFSVPIYLLPGNHDADSPAAFWSTGDVLKRFPSSVHLVRDTAPVQVPGVAAEVAGAPWPSRRPDSDLLGSALSQLTPVRTGTVRVVLGHGGVDSLAPDPLNEALISVAGLMSALSDRRATYIALGDRHSVTRIADCAWYCGAPVATDFDEVDPNKALVVDLDSNRVAVEPIDIGGWRFVRKRFDLNGPEGVSLVETYLAEIPEKERTVVRLAFIGTINLSTNELLEQVLDKSKDLLAGLERSELRSELLVLPDDSDLAALDLSGFASDAVAELAGTAAGDTAGAEVARDALMLLHRLAARSR